jgi:hypothetical protein
MSDVEFETNSMVLYFNNRMIEIIDLGDNYAFSVSNTFRSGYQSKNKAIEAAKVFILTKNA